MALLRKFIESLSSLQVYSLPVRLGRLHQRPLHSCLCLHLIVLDPSSQGASLHLPHPAPIHLYSCWYEPSLCVHVDSGNESIVDASIQIKSDHCPDLTLHACEV